MRGNMNVKVRLLLNVSHIVSDGEQGLNYVLTDYVLLL
jgi:hypothetical protein